MFEDDAGILRCVGLGLGRARTREEFQQRSSVDVLLQSLRVTLGQGDMKCDMLAQWLSWVGMLSSTGCRKFAQKQGCEVMMTYTWRRNRAEKLMKGELVKLLACYMLCPKPQTTKQGCIAHPHACFIILLTRE